MSENTQITLNATPQPSEGEQRLAAQSEQIQADIQAQEAANTVPEKFRGADGTLNTEKLLASYNELEKAYAGKAPTQEESAPSEPQGLSIEKKVEPAKGLNDPQKNAEFVAEFLETGTLSDASIEAMGWGVEHKESVVEYFQLKHEAQQRSDNAIIESIGGQESFAAMSEWAVSNLSEGELDAYNNAVQAGGEYAKLAVEALNSKFKSTQSQEPGKRLTGNEIVSQGDVYFSQQDWLNDMMKPEYKSSPEFQNKVLEKLRRSNI
jgi:hypothetical protein